MGKKYEKLTNLVEKTWFYEVCNLLDTRAKPAVLFFYHKIQKKTEQILLLEESLDLNTLNIFFYLVYLINK